MGKLDYRELIKKVLEKYINYQVQDESMIAIAIIR